MVMVTVAFGSNGLPSATPPAAEPAFEFPLEPLLELEEQAAPAVAMPAAVTSATTVRDALCFIRFTPESMDREVPCRCHPACRERTAANNRLQESDEKSKEHD
jgi:hypothetical protein